MAANVSYTEFVSAKHVEQSQREIPETKEKQFNRDPRIIPLTDPLERIALCLSGGGYRAAAFSLGTLAYLNEVSFKDKTLLQRVCLISSASGGSITSLSYGVHVARGEADFQNFFDTLRGKLAGEKVIEKALTILNDNSKWKGTKKRTLINAFAQTYNDALFEGADMALLASIKSDLKLCVNATEFYRGLTFRFQNFGFIGNQFISLDKDQAHVTGKIKVADVLAASSCFPVGFEPIEFPRDYAHAELSEDALRAVTSVLDYNYNPIVSVDTIPLMDGGITDNQGINSAMLTDLYARENNTPAISLFVVTDVASYFMDAYEPPPTNKGLLRFFSLTSTYVIAVVLGFLGFAASIWLLQNWTESWPKYVGAALFAPSAGVVIWFVYDLFFNLVKKISMYKNGGFGVLKALFQIKNFSDEILRKQYHYLRKAQLSVLVQMVRNRLSATAVMVLDVNLKQVRRLINDLFYSNALFENRRCTNYIYAYSSLNYASKSRRICHKKWNMTDKALMTPSRPMCVIAEEARDMGTTLWFDNKDVKAKKLEKLIATGKFTVCGSLLEYILDLKSDSTAWNLLDTPTREAVGELEARLRQDWAKFKVTPFQP